MAATAGILNGTLLSVSLGGTAIAAAKSCKVSITHEPRDTFTKDDAGWKTNGEGARSWKMDCDGLVTLAGFSTLFSAISARTELTISFESSNPGDKSYSGTAYITSLEQSAGNEESTSYTASFEGGGVLTEAVTT